MISLTCLWKNGTNAVNGKIPFIAKKLYRLSDQTSLGEVDQWMRKCFGMSLALTMKRHGKFKLYCLYVCFWQSHCLIWEK